MDDLISRQAAIDKADSLYRDTKNDECYMITGYNHAISDIRAILKSLPSAQPEIIRCKDCKHKPTGSGINHDIIFPDQDYRCPCRCEDYWYSWMPDDDWFCANGERRTDE